MLWPTAQLIETHWSGKPLGSHTLPHHTAAETRTWPRRLEAPQGIAEPASDSGETQARPDYGQLRSSL
jgi:hypothetical protein